MNCLFIMNSQFIHPLILQIHLKQSLLLLLQYIKERRMSIFAYFNSLKDIFQNSKKPKSIAEATDSFDYVKEKPHKISTNDSTMFSLTKNDSSLSNSSRQPSSSKIFHSNIQKFSQRRLQLFTSESEKSHANISYFTSNGTKLSPVRGKQMFEQQQKAQRKRVRGYEGESFQQERNRMHKKFISNQWMPRQREQKYGEINSALARHTIKAFSQSESMNNNIFKVRFLKSQKATMRKKHNQVASSDLPDLGDFTINYSMESLEEMTISQLTSVSGLIVHNEWGKIQFLQPVSLYRKDLNQCLTLSLEGIKITDTEWRRKQIRLTIYNKTIFNQKNRERIMENAASLGLSKSKFDESSGSFIFTY